MAVKIRLKRMGQKKAPYYRIVVANATSPRDGRFIEEIGTYDPNQDPSAFSVNEEAAKKCSTTVHSRQKSYRKSLNLPALKSNFAGGGL